MKTIVKGEYSDVISTYIQSSFPKIATISESSLLEILTKLIVGTKDMRFGPIPKPESLVVIRQLIQKSIDENKPIPVLVPWGGRKMDKSLYIDMAEVSALKQLIVLGSAVKGLHKPGLDIHIRIEDVNAEWLYKDKEGIDVYSNGMKNLIDILKGDLLIKGILESEMMSSSDYFSVSGSYSPLLFRMMEAQESLTHIAVEDIPEYQRLVEAGWKGVIPKEQRDYYLSRYQKLYPESTGSERIQMLADYFAGSKARYDLNGRGFPAGQQFIQLNFAHPVPGAPVSIFNNTVYWRTVPESAGRTHCAPWRGRGYLKIVGNEVIPKITHSKDEVQQLESTYIKLVEGDLSVIVEVDYMVVDVATIYSYSMMM